MDDEKQRDKQHTYENWRAITESDFVTLYIKTWFAFVATLREMYPDKAKPYYKATGDSPYLSAYKDDFDRKVFFHCDYDSIEQNLHDVYQRGLRITCQHYPHFLLLDFYTLNQSFKESALERFESPGGYSGELRLVVRNKGKGICKAEIVCSDKKIIDEAGIKRVVASVDVNYEAMLELITKFVEEKQPALPEDGLLYLFYDVFFKEITSKLLDELEKIKNALPDRGKQRLKNTFSVMQSFALRAGEGMKKTCLSSDIGEDHKLLAQAPVTGFLQTFSELSTIEKQRAFLWFIGYAYRLRNALFHEIIDPLDAPWQLLFKSAYLVLKHVVDINIFYLKMAAIFVESAPMIFEQDFRAAPPPEIPIEPNDSTDFSIESVELQYFNETGAKVHIRSLVTCKGISYQVECNVKWDEKLKDHKVKNVVITKDGV
ncbi:MAG: hypothetical protein J5449_02500 [Oscillospiraceae bacterium]|nr:hypothetical protein [Oscillospiraceae bacterium]